MRLLQSIAMLCTGLIPLALPAQGVGLPRLVHAFTSSRVDDSPANRLTAIRVGPQGTVLFVSNTAVDSRLVLMDSTGQVLQRFGRPGQGPGEVRAPSPVAVTRDVAMVWDLASQRLSEWDLHGKLIRETTLSVPAEPHQLLGSEVLALHSVQGLWQPAAINPITGSVRPLLLATDTFVAKHFSPSAATAGPQVAPIVGSWDGGFLVGDANRYQIALYRPNGALVRVLSRNVAAAFPSPERVNDFLTTMKRAMEGRGGKMDDATMSRLREMASKQALPLFTPSGTNRADAQHRIWIVGMEGDSAFADLFTAERFIGRVHLPCRLFNNFWSVSETWLAMACLPDDPHSDLDAVVKLFKLMN
jgi:hypothetical protein